MTFVFVDRMDEVLPVALLQKQRSQAELSLGRRVCP